MGVKDGRNRDFLFSYLKERVDTGAFRDLSVPTIPKTDLSSNDFLGLARDPKLKERVRKAVRELDPCLGATGSRLISGNSPLYAELEQDLPEWFKAEAGLVFNSGYDANIGLLGSVPGRHDTVVFDELVHASIRDGVRIGMARSFSFRHNDPEDLRKKIAKARGRVFVVVESLYSMDGDEAPLRELLESMKDREECYLIVDEAHAVGMKGEHGEGVVPSHGLEERVFARVCTFGKALGTQGAIVLGDLTLKYFLVNFARHFIYSTGLPETTLLAIKEAFQVARNERERAEWVQGLAQRFDRSVGAEVPFGSLPSRSHIKGLFVPGNEDVQRLAEFLQRDGFDVKPIRSPTVPKGKERIRFCFHYHNSEEEVDRLIRSLKTGYDQLFRDGNRN